jgi:homoserine kinase
MISLTWPEGWGIILVIPPSPLSTEAARAVMPAHYSQAEVVANLRGMAAWIYAIEHQDPALFAYAMASDTVHQPARAQLIPEFSVLKETLAASDAIGCVISGSGSTLAVYTPNSASQQATLSLLKSSEGLSHCTMIPVKPDITGVCEQPARSASATTQFA